MTQSTSVGERVGERERIYCVTPFVVYTLFWCILFSSLSRYRYSYTLSLSVLLLMSFSLHLSLYRCWHKFSFGLSLTPSFGLSLSTSLCFSLSLCVFLFLYRCSSCSVLLLFPVEPLPVLLSTLSLYAPSLLSLVKYRKLCLFLYRCRSFSSEITK